MRFPAGRTENRADFRADDPEQVRKPPLTFGEIGHD